MEGTAGLLLANLSILNQQPGNAYANPSPLLASDT